jgi:SAM-dependent methyltransferase
MKERLLEYIVCPRCAADLDLKNAQGTPDEVVAGELRCMRGCGSFPIAGGIPRLLPGAIAADKQRTAAAFGWEWQEFDRLHDDDRTRAQFLDWIAPIAPGFFRDKVVLDAGCGMGRFAAESARFGAREVIAVDLSDAVVAAARNLRDVANAHVVQADIYHLPLRRRADRPVVDFAYSIGVLHHLPDPEAGFAAITAHLKPGGAIFAWVYGRENNGWIVHAVNPLRETVFSRLPRPVLYAVSFAFTAALELPLVALYRPASRIPALRPLQRVLPYRAYLTWLSGFGFRHNHHVVFDHLVAPTAFYLRREEFAAWFERAGLAETAISARNDNSWRGFGRVRQDA